MSAPSSDARDAQLAAAAIGMTLPTALPGYFYVVAMMEGHSWLSAWLQTCVVEVLLAICGALVGVLAVRAIGNPGRRALPLAPLLAMAAVGLGAAIFAGSRNAGYGEAGILVLLIWIVGSPLGVTIQLGAGALVWALARVVVAPTRRLPTLGAVVLAHVILKSWSTPLVLGTMASVLGVVVASRMRSRGGIVFFVVVAIASVAIEIARLMSFASTQAAGYAIDPF